MFRAIVLSSIVVSVAVATNNGYQALRQQLDEYVANSYGKLEHVQDEELQKTGRQVLSKYRVYTSE